MARKPKIIPRRKSKSKAPAEAPAEISSPVEAVQAVKPEEPALVREDIPTDPAAARAREAAQVFAFASNLQRQGKYEEAIDAYSRALYLEPANADIYNNLGICLRALGRLAASATCYRRALVLRHDDADLLSNLGNVLRDMQEYPKAITCLVRALEINPKSPQALYNLALALRDVHEVDKAIECLELAVSLHPDDITLHVELGLALLMKGELERGFAEFERRLTFPAVQARMPDALLWDGQSFGGKTILIYQDGGLSDVVQFARYIPYVKERGAIVVVECHARMAGLISTLKGVDRVCISGNQRPNFQFHAPITSLSHILGMAASTLADQSPYLSVPDGHSVQLPLKRDQQIRVGLCWSPDVTRRGALDRSCSLDTMLKLLAIPGVSAFSLQGGERANDLKSSGCPALMSDLGDKIGGVPDLCAVIDQLDLVICTDSLTAHLAGALGKPVWVLLPFVSDWRWHSGEGTSLWYSDMRLFRQTHPGHWDDVIERVHQALLEHVTNALEA